MFTRYIVKPFPSADWKHTWGIWDRAAAAWYESGMSRVQAQHQVAILNRDAI